MLLWGSALVVLYGCEALPGRAEVRNSREFRDCDQCPVMVALPGGEYEMGSPEGEDGRYMTEGPVHRVKVGGFAMGKHEVTQGQWRALMKSSPSVFGHCGDDCPVENVSWNDAKDYVRKLNRKLTGSALGPYRLPSEAEWEYACRGGVAGQRYCGGDKVDGVAWYWGNSGRWTHSVGGKMANGFGLRDMTGNVVEWVEDCWNESYEGAPADGSAWESGDCLWRVSRGGSWGMFHADVRSANRFRFRPAVRFDGAGFRVARAMP